jgi:hypothetical protein
MSKGGSPAGRPVRGPGIPGGPPPRPVLRILPRGRPICTLPRSSAPLRRGFRL